MLASTIRALDADRLWSAVLGRLEIEMTPANYITWMDGTKAADWTNGLLTVQATTAFASDELNRRFRAVVERAAAEITGETVEVKFRPPGAGRVHRDPGHAPLLGHEGPRDGGPRLTGTLNPAFTFESYLEAGGNVLALRACTGLVEGEGPSMSPVVVHAAPGLGKTHLLHATAQAAAGHGWAVACLSGEQFTNGYLTAMRDRDATGFQQTLRGVRLLVIDDLHYLEGKTGTANELVHTVDAVTNAGGHVVIAGERHPAELDLPDRLVSRLTAGLVTAIEPFRAHERRTFIERAAQACGASLPGWAINRLAELEAPSVRVLKGALNRALALASCGRLTEDELDGGLAADLIAQRKTVTIATAIRETDTVLERVARLFEVPVSDLTGRSRRREVSDARAVAAAALRDQGLSLAETAEALGGRDRSTVRQLAERGKALAAADAQARYALAN